jgi:N-methylhydantoinase A
VKRISVDIGGTFTDCFVAWDGRYVQAKALTTHHNLAQGFNEALDHACLTLGLRRDGVLREVDSVRYATTLGTNALIERTGPQVGAIVTAGFEATIPLSRGRGYGEGLDELAKNDMSSGTRPDPLVPQTLIRSVSERVDFRGTVLLELDRQDVRRALTELVDAGAEALVVCLTNAVENPVHELAVQEIFLSSTRRTSSGRSRCCSAISCPGARASTCGLPRRSSTASCTPPCTTRCRSWSRTCASTVTPAPCWSSTTPAGWRS